MSNSSTSPFRMSISLNVLNHLGIGLYSNTPAVLSEIVANAWDAEATQVNINIDKDAQEIKIHDNGSGMSRRDINERYLKVGYDKRGTEGSATPYLHRPVMGRKGIGKLSVFSIANIVEVHSVKNGQVNGLILDAEAIKKKIEQEGQPTREASDETPDYNYYPDEVSLSEISIDVGTLIILRDMHKGISRTGEFLRKRLARRFSIIGEEHDFNVIVNREPISVRDRDFFRFFDSVWYFGSESESVVEKCPNLEESHNLDSLVHKNYNFRVRGWIGTVAKQKHISSEDNTNAIVVFAHGKLVQEDILSTYKEGGWYSKYIVGELDADFLDMDDEPDIVTSNRQSVQEDDERYVLLKEFLWEALKKIQADWAAMRENVSTKRATEYPVIKEWYSTLQGDSKTTAQKMFRKIESLPFPDESSKVEMYKATILAHERLAMSSALSILDNLDTPEQFETIAALFRDIDDIEAAHYLEIVRGRLEVVKKFDNILPDSKEKILQEYLFDHLWLLDPSWERAATDPRIEQRVANEIEAIEARLTNGERRGRIDIRYRTAAGKHIIIELKKYNRTVTVPELIDQIGKYKTGLEKVLSTHHPEEKNLIEIIIILGDHPRSDGANAERVLAEYSARYILYDALIQDTLESYNDYLEKQREVNELASLLDRLTNELLE